MSINIGSLMSTPFPLLNVINSLLPSPLCRIEGLKPDRSASSYIISQSDYQQSFLSQKASQQHKQALLQQISQLQVQLFKSTSLLQSNQSQYHQQFLLLKLQIERVRTIMREQGYAINKQLSQFNQLQQVYKLKLQQTKHILTKAFQEELKHKHKQSLNLLQQVRQLYVNKISILTQSYQKQLQQKELRIHQCNSQMMNMKISSIKEVQLGEQLVRVNEENKGLIEEVYSLRKVLEEERQYRANLIDETDNNQHLLRCKNDQLLTTNTRLHQQITSINNYITTITNSHSQSLNKLTQQLQSKNQQLQMLRWKCNKLEEELDQFKNRKTQGMGNLVGESYKKYQRVEEGDEGLEYQREQHNSDTNNHTVFGGHFPCGNVLHPNNNTSNNNPDRRSDTQQRISYQQIRYQTQSRISYQRSIKKIHQMQLKIEQLSQQLYKSNTQNQLMSQKINQLKDQLQDQSLHVNQLRGYLTEKDQIIQNMVHTQQQQQQSILSKNPVTQMKQKDTFLIQKDQTISTLTQQLQQLRNYINSMQKQLQRLNKKQMNYQTQLLTIQQSYKSKLKSKQSQLRTIEEEYRKLSTIINDHLKQFQQRDKQLRVKQQQIYKLQTERSRLQTAINQHNLIIKLKEQQVVKLGEIIEKLTEDNRLMRSQMEELEGKCKEIENLGKVENSIIVEKHERIVDRDSDNPFADPFLKQYDHGQQQYNHLKKYSSPSTTPNYSKPPINTTTTKQLQARLLQYQQKISQLQSIVQQLKFQWGATQQNENAIFSYMKAAYIDQIKTLKTKNEQMENDMKYSGEFLQIMAKKQAMDSQAMYGSKSKSKGKK